jgi:hypothetical protein
MKKDIQYILIATPEIRALQEGSLRKTLRKCVFRLVN